VAPPDQDVGIVEHIVAQAVIRLVQADGTVADAIDAFTYYKSRALLICGGLIVLFFAACVCIGDVKIKLSDLKDPILAASAAYIFFIAVSTAFSKYRALALSGFTDRHESVFILIVYIILFFTVKIFSKDGTRVRFILFFLLASSLVIGTIGAFQAFGLDLYSTAFGNRVVLGKEIFDIYYPPGLTIKFPDRVYSTLFNPNCVGLYASLLIPVFFVSSLFYFKHAGLKILSAVGGLL